MISLKICIFKKKINKKKHTYDNTYVNIFFFMHRPLIKFITDFGPLEKLDDNAYLGDLAKLAAGITRMIEDATPGAYSRKMTVHVMC